MKNQGIVFVVDSADDMRFQVASYEFEQILGHDGVKDRDIPILIFLNKTDLKDACSEQECVDFLALGDVKNKAWHLQYTQIITNP